MIKKHLESGLKIGLHFGSRGEIFIKAIVLNEDENLSREIEFIIDTGFNGFLQLPQKIASDLNLKIIDKNKTTGYDGIEKEVGITKTKIKILEQEIWNFPIQLVEQGTTLMGTNLLLDLKKMLVIDYRNGIVTLTDEPKVQKKVHKTIDKYAK